MSWLLSSLPSIPLWSSDSKEKSEKDVIEEEEDLDVPPPFPLPNSYQRSAAPAAIEAPSAPSFALAPPSPTRSPSPPSELNIAILNDPIPIGDMAPPVSTTTRPTFGIKPGGGMEPPSSLSPSPTPAPVQGLSTTGAKKKGKGKVALAPGCSALDWARLAKSGADLRGTGSMQPLRVTMDELKKHKTRDDAWSVFNGVVYNITPYLRFHPGGEDELMRVAGRDGTKLFMLTHSWVNLEHLLAECVIGMLVRG